MRGFRVMFVVAALCCAARAEASRPICLEYEWVPNDAGTVTDGGTDGGTSSDAGEVQNVPIPVDPADTVGGARIPAPPTVHRVCSRMGYRDEGGCSVAGGLPTAGLALAALALMVLRVRRKVR